MSDKEHKIHTGFRLSKQNVKFIEDTGSSLGLNKTGMLDLLLTVIRKNPAILSDMITKAITKR